MMRIRQRLARWQRSLGSCLIVDGMSLGVIDYVTVPKRYALFEGIHLSLTTFTSEADGYELAGLQ
jgi:hypothetical protein